VSEEFISYSTNESRDCTTVTAHLKKKTVGFNTELTKCTCYYRNVDITSSVDIPKQCPTVRNSLLLNKSFFVYSTHTRSTLYNIPMIQPWWPKFIHHIVGKFAYPWYTKHAIALRGKLLAPKIALFISPLHQCRNNTSQNDYLGQETRNQ